MSLIIWLVASITVYIVTFQNDFNHEELEKVAPVMAIVAIVVLVGSILLSLLAR